MTSDDPFNFSPPFGTQKLERKQSSSLFTPLPSFGIPSSNPWSTVADSALPGSNDDIWGSKSTSTTNSLTTQASSDDTRNNSLGWSVTNDSTLSNDVISNPHPLGANSLRSSLSIDVSHEQERSPDRSFMFRPTAVNVPQRSTSLTQIEAERNAFLETPIAQDRSPIFRSTACNIPASMLPRPHQPSPHKQHAMNPLGRAQSAPYDPHHSQHAQPHFCPPPVIGNDRHYNNRQYSNRHSLSNPSHHSPSQILDFNRSLSQQLGRQTSLQSLDQPLHNPNPTNALSAASPPYVPQSHQQQSSIIGHAQQQHAQPLPAQHHVQPPHQMHPQAQHVQPPLCQPVKRITPDPSYPLGSLQNPFIRVQEPNPFAKPYSKDESGNDARTPSTCESGGQKMNANSDAFIPKADRSLCRYFQKGHCVYGAKCWYRHAGPPGGAVATKSPEPQNEQEKIEYTFLISGLEC